METEILTPGLRPAPPEEVLDFLFAFLSAGEFVRAEDDLRLRARPPWRTFDEALPTERGEQLLRFVQEDLRGTRAEFHHVRLRRILLVMLKEAGAGRWIDVRRLAHLARNQYLATLDQRTTADRFQRRYQYTPVPALASPGLISRELAQFAGTRLALAGLAEVYAPEDGITAVRLTRLGAAVLGASTGGAEATGDGALIVTADFEVVVFPDLIELDAMQAINRFCRREKADVTVHYRLTDRSVQEAIAAGMTMAHMLEILRRHARYELPQNVVASCESWGRAVTVLESRRVMLLKAPTREAMEEALKVRELKAIAGERLSDTCLELLEDPTALRIAEALRMSGFFFR